MRDEKTYTIKARYIVAGEGWKEDVTRFTGTYEAAGREASRQARELDAKYGSEHFWTVDCYGYVVDNHACDGSYFQLFHGRTS